MWDNRSFYEMVSYCQNISKCYCILIAQHFDEVWNSEACNRMCDNCCEDIACERKNVTAHCRDLIKILKEAKDLNEKLTPLKLIESETSYLKIGSKANLNSDAHLITMQVKKPMQSCFRIHSEGADKKREEKNPGNFQKSANML